MSDIIDLAARDLVWAMDEIKLKYCLTKEQMLDVSENASGLYVFVRAGSVHAGEKEFNETI